MSGAQPKAAAVSAETAPSGTHTGPGSAAAIKRRWRARLAEMVAHVRANSPYYRELYRDLPERVEDPALLPVTSKKELMARFDDWPTDRDVTMEKVRAFVEDSGLIGERFLDRYTVATTAGTTGTRGIFVMDDRSLAAINGVIEKEKAK